MTSPDNIYTYFLENFPEPAACYRVLKDNNNPVDYIIHQVNSAYEKMAGVKRENLMDKKISELRGELGVASLDLLEKCRRVFPGGGSFSFEHYLESRDWWYEVRGFSNNDYIFMLLRDINKEKREKEKLKKNLTRFCSLVKSSQAGLVVEDDQRKIIATNQLFCDIFLIPASPESLEGTDFSLAAREAKHLLAQPDLFLQGINEIVKRRQPVIGEEILFANGRVFERDYNPVFDEGENFIGHMWSYREITRRKRMEKELQESEKSQRGLANYHRILSQASLNLNELDNEKEIIEGIADYLRELTGAFGVCVSLYNERTDELIPQFISMDSKAREQVEHLVGPFLEECVSSVRCPLGEDIKEQMLGQVINRPLTLEELTFGVISREKSDFFMEKLEIKEIIALSLHHGRKLVGSVVAYHQGKGLNREDEILKTFAYIAGLVLTRKRAEKELREREALQQIIMKLATDFVNVPLERVDEEINSALETIGEYTGVDRVYIFKHDYKRRITTNTHEWCREGISPQIDKLQKTPFEFFPDTLERHERGEVVYIPWVEDMTRDQPLRSVLLAQDIKSLILFPLVAQGKCLGLVGFDAVEEYKGFTEAEVSLLKVLAELLTNIELRRRKDEEIRYMSFHDRLTGLYNRAFLEEEMQRLDTDRQLPLSIIMADLNGLKLVNDAYGHNVGDEMLICTARVLKDSSRKEDIVARWGGDEFVLILPQTPAEEAQKICNRIYENALHECVNDIVISMALGVASKRNREEDIYEVFKEAENQMYKHKLIESRSNRSVLLKTLLKTLKEKSNETEEHALRMQEMALKIGKRLNLPGTELDRLNLLVSLHDLGKIVISEDILKKEESLTEEEWEIIKKHTITGFRIARSTEEFAHVAEDILAHHEHWDGSGYPDGLQGEDIPLLARIVALVDAYDVITHGRPYKKALFPREAAEEIRRCAGSQFDPKVVEVFLSLLEEEGLLQEEERTRKDF